MRLLTLVTLLSPLALRLASGFYAEPFAALCLAAGLRRATVVGDRRGWLIAGCAGLFRPEGLIIAAAYAWFAGGGGRRSRGRRLLMAAAPGLAWQAVVGCSGGGLEDFAFAAGPCLANVRSCVRVIGGYLTVRLAETGALPLVGLLLVPWRRLAVSLLLLILGGAAVSCTVSPHADWVVGETLPRFLWLVLVPQVIGLVTACSQKMNRPPLVSISDKPYNTRP